MPIKQIDELPAITKNVILPFDKLAWEDFERFCFQLGSKSMKCLDTSYIYGRRGQKQDGIDIYFRDKSQNKVWQIKRYTEFKKADVTDAVNKFLSGKWYGNSAEFVLCVSNYLDDVDVIDEIDRQSSILKARGIVFSVFNSEKLSIKAKKYPELIETFFGKHWLEALGISKNNADILRSNFYWKTDTGKIIKSEKIYQHGDFKLRFDDNMVYVDEQLPDGKDTHVVFDTESG